MSYYWTCGTLAVGAVVYGAGMWYIGMLMGMSLMQRNPPRDEPSSVQVPRAFYQAFEEEDA